MTTALRAEWTKQRTLAGPAWLLLTATLLTVGLGALVAASMHCPIAHCGVDTTKISLTGVQLGQAVVAVLAVLSVGNEYSTGMIQTTIAAIPRRGIMLAAKAAVVSGPVLVAGAVAALGSILAGRLILPGQGFDAAHGYAPLSLADGPTLRATGGAVLYLVLIGLLSLGLATLVRDSAASIGVVLGLLYLVPLLISAISDKHLHRHLEQISPQSGLNIMTTLNVHDLSLSPWQGLGVLALWAVGALLVGGLVLRLRDA